jgi:hypothetical protein
MAGKADIKFDQHFLHPPHKGDSTEFEDGHGESFHAAFGITTKP